MNDAYISALAALAGSGMGALASVGTTWLTQRYQECDSRILDAYYSPNVNVETQRMRNAENYDVLRAFIAASQTELKGIAQVAALGSPRGRSQTLRAGLETSSP